MVPGTQVGAYRVLQQIGEGGMGSVWLAEHTMLGRRAAIKVLHPMFTARPDIVMRFFNEARAATAISDPGIVQIFDFGTHVDGCAYIAMEMLEGEPLDRRLRRLGRMPIADALRILRQVASTLGVAHQRGIVHRDLKPENIFLVRDPEVIGGERAKVLDFGIAKLTGEAGAHTNTSTVMGTPAYMSPEQCRGAGRVDQRSDVYSLGCMLFALVTGGPPFEADGGGEIIAMHLRERPPAPSARVRGIPRELDVLVARCLAKEPAQRPASGTELAAAIGGLLATRAITSSPAITADALGAAAGPSASITTLSSASGATLRVPQRRPSRRAWWAVGAGLIAGSAVIGAIVARSGGVEPSHAPAEPPIVRPVARPATPPAAPAVAAPDSRAPVPHPAAPPAPPPAVPPPPPAAPPLDPNAQLAGRMTTVLNGFAAWARNHAGAPCPKASALAAVVQDPWGNPIQITCTDQPANQIIGAISAGPDGKLGTPDDIGSWQLGRDVTDVVHGARWVAAPPPAPARPARPSRPKPDDDIPRER
jgi:serine/threonine-protein kinase